MVLLSALLHCVLQVLASKSSTYLIIIIKGYVFKVCPLAGGIRRVNTTNGISSMLLGDDGYEGYLEICTNTITGTQLRPLCGGERWTREYFVHVSQCIITKQ